MFLHQIWIWNWSIMHNWPCTKRLIQIINAAFLIFNQSQAEGSIIQQSSRWDSPGPNPERHSTLVSILPCWGWSSRDHRKFSKSYILSEALNALLAVSRMSPLLLCVCVCVCVCLCVIAALEQDLGLSLTHIHTHKHAQVHCSIT